MFETFEHTADLGLRVKAASREELFVDAARGLFSIMVTDLDTVQPVVRRSYTVPGVEHDYLLFDWLNELLYTFESEKLLLSQFDVSIAGGQLQAMASGEVMDLQRHRMEHEVKAITYHGLRVEHRDGAWLAEVIVDI
jgi:SHS2 domain-containing protein